MSIEGFGPKVEFPAAFPGSLVHDGNAPIAMTDLDLSSVVGARRCLVWIDVLKDSANNRGFRFRTNGDTAVPGGYSITYCDCSQNYKGHVMAITDPAGIVEWYCDAAEQCKIYVVGFAHV